MARRPRGSTSPAELAKACVMMQTRAVTVRLLDSPLRRACSGRFRLTFSPIAAGFGPGVVAEKAELEKQRGGGGGRVFTTGVRGTRIKDEKPAAYVGEK